ncbi:MAG: alanine:cation symporter family protein, partial [Spirochaetaceae bacterium]|nr:alanine:cation symporter family protein [Spirochaetaceae bacterium]
MMEVVDFINGILWHDSLTVLCLGVALILTIVLGCPQITHIKDMFKYLTKGKESDSGLSSFQTFAMALGGRVGTGNIAGVATAIYFGGPGAVFWMWVYAVLGAATAFTEAALAQTFKRTVNGEYRSGPPYYCEQLRIKGKKLVWFGAVFAVADLIGLVVTGPTVQAFTIADSMKVAFGIPPWISGAIQVILFAIIMAGGMKRIGHFAARVVPFMAFAYILIAIILIIGNIGLVPAVVGSIFASAFGGHAVFGGLIGSAIAWGIRRAVYSSEAGFGTGACASGASEVSHPCKQGLAQALTVFIDTLGVCTATAFIILMTGMYSVEGADGSILYGAKAIIDSNIEAGTGYTQMAVSTMFGSGFGEAFIAIAVFFFAFTTNLAFGYYCKPETSYLIKN